jgi:hypothetical protein
MDHLVQFTISIDDKHIAQMVEKEAAKTMQDEVLKVCKSQIGCKADYWGNNQPGPALKKAIDDFMKDNREEIIDRAADKLADRLSRTKVVKEAAAKRILEETL